MENYCSIFFSDCKSHGERSAFLNQIATWADNAWPKAAVNGQELKREGRLVYFRDLVYKNPNALRMLQFAASDALTGRKEIVNLGYSAIYPEIESVGNEHFNGTFNQYTLNEDSIEGPHTLDDIKFYYVQAFLLAPDYHGKSAGGCLHLSALERHAYRHIELLGLDRNPSAIVFAEIFHDKIEERLRQYGWSIGPNRSANGKLIAHTTADKLSKAGGWFLK
jgi:hypothetical protein